MTLISRNVIVIKYAQENKKGQEGSKEMSGHSKFANIKHKKERHDAKKGKIFTIIGREIVIAVK